MHIKHRREERVCGSLSAMKNDDKKNIGSKIKAAIAIALSTSFLFTGKASADSEILRVGDKGEKVEKLQRTLRVLEFYDYPELEGYFGTDTRSALMNFQKEHGLDVNGVADADTFRALDEALDECYPEIKYMGNMRLHSVGEDVMTLQQVLKTLGYYGMRPNGVYNANTASAVRTFQFDYGMQVDGVVNERLVKKINAVSSSLRPFRDSDVELDSELQTNIVTEQVEQTGTSIYHTDAVKMQWRAVKTAWKLGKVLKITDVETGITVNLKRTGGSNHSDAEPCTQEDTDNLKIMFGGDWSWARRPIVAQISYITAAASICGMPHGDNIIADNGVYGHFCVYFYESTDDDGFNVMDSAHKKAIDIAANYSFDKVLQE